MEKQIKIKKSWDDITIGQYVELRSMEKTDYPDLIDKGIFMVDTIYQVESKNIAYMDFIKLLETLDFLQQKPVPKKATTRYQLNDTEYQLDLNYNNLTTSQFVDFSAYREQDDYIGMLSVVLYPINHTYCDGYDMEKVKQDLESISVTEALGIIDFFYTASTSFVERILNYLLKMTKRRTKKTDRRKIEALSKAIQDWQRMAFCPIL